MRNVSQILTLVLDGYPPQKEDLTLLLSTSDRGAMDDIFSAARELRAKYFKSNILLYGFVYLSTYCRNDCRFCNFRSSLRSLERYRKTFFEIIEASMALAQSGVHLIDLTMGEDVSFITEPGYSLLLDCLAEIKEKTSLPIMFSPGKLGRNELKKAKSKGANWYACYQETHNRALFSHWRKGQDFDERLKAKLIAKEEGLLVEEGVLVGAGASCEDLADSILAMRELGAQQVRAMAYVPTPNGLLPDDQVNPAIQELLMIACLRLSIPGALIPASLDVEGLVGLEPRLKAGANVVTSLVPGGMGLAGVAQAHFDIENQNRSPAMVREKLAELKYNLTEVSEYKAWLVEKGKFCES
jgi:methylornithine synthase